tara:strand:- start:3113 stop:4504 length:1392 start_codon:yes stop_codon:yes gene_type:complete
MVIRTFFDKNNTIVKNQLVNTGLNPVTELFYGDSFGSEKYSRFLFHFDGTRLINLYTGGTYTDLTKLKHTLRMTNTASFDTDLLNSTMGSKERASSFDLIVFEVNQIWDNGVGYDYDVCNNLQGDCAYSNKPSNWVEAQTGVFWDNGTGVYSGSPSGITISTQHFDKGNENIEIDITDYVNGIITGNTNNGLGIAFGRGYELMSSSCPQYVGFFTNNTQTFYEPFVETIYDNHITDDRHNFILDKPNKLYLYTNVNGNPINLDTKPSVNIDGYSSYTPSQVNHISKGVYSIDLLVDSASGVIDTILNDEWSGISINGVSRPNITLDFVLKDSMEYYNLGSNAMLPKQVAVSIGGLLNKEKIKRGDIRKVIVSARIPYTVEQTQYIDNLKYRLYVSEGGPELTVIDFQPVEMTNNHYYFLLDTASLIPNTYYLDVLATSNLETTTLKNVIQFDIVNQVDLRHGQ